MPISISSLNHSNSMEKISHQIRMLKKDQNKVVWSHMAMASSLNNHSAHTRSLPQLQMSSRTSMESSNQAEIEVKEIMRGMHHQINTIVMTVIEETTIDQMTTTKMKAIVTEKKRNTIVMSIADRMIRPIRDCKIVL